VPAIGNKYLLGSLRWSEWRETDNQVCRYRDNAKFSEAHNFTVPFFLSIPLLYPHLDLCQENDLGARGVRVRLATLCVQMNCCRDP